MTENSGEIKVFEPGQNLFLQGEPGGDLFFIREGKVQVFIEQDGQPINLAQLDSGEVLGLLTCVSKTPRTATAKAIDQVTTLVVKYEQFQSLLSKCPDWLKTILKELTVRVTQMNDKYAQALMLIKKLKTTQVSPLFIGSQVASALPVVAPLALVTQEEKKFILVEELTEKLEQILTRPKDEITKVLEVFQNSGLIKVEIEPEKKRRVIDLEVAKRVPPFAKFVLESRAGKAKKVVNAKLTPKEFRTLRGLSPLAKSLNIELKGLVKIKMKDCVDKFTKVTNIPFDKDVLHRAAKLGILEVQGDGENMQVVFAPSDMSRTLVFAEAYGMLDRLSEESAAVTSPKKAA